MTLQNISLTETSGNAVRIRIVVSFVLFSTVGYLIGIFLMYNDPEIKGLFNYFDYRLFLFFVPLANLMGFLCNAVLSKLNKVFPWQSLMLARFSIGYIATLLISVLIALIPKILFNLNNINTLTPIKLSNLQLQLFFKLLAILTFILFIYNLIHLVSYSYQKFFINSLKLKRIKREQMNLHIEALKNQLTPHYLFNNLNTVSTLITREKKNADKYIRNFANSCRFIIDNSRNILITVKQELEFAKTYFYLMETRFPGTLNLEVNIPESLSNLNIPPLSIQMLIENAIKHNTLNVDKMLKIRVFTSDKNYLTIENNITEESATKNLGNIETQVVSKPGQVKVGIQNLKMRYSYLTDTPVIIEKNSFYTVKLPLINSLI